MRPTKHKVDAFLSTPENPSVHTIYFAYGSNLEVKSMEARCPNAQVVNKARLEGWAFRINERGYATIVPEPTKSVLGLLWRLEVRDVEALDDYEAVAEGLYTKAQVEVVDSVGQRVEAMVYHATNPRPGRPREGYLEGILIAATQFGFPAEYREELRGWLGNGIYGS